MAFLRVNGIAVPVLNDAAEFSVVDFGERGRAPDGSMWLQRTALKREARFRTPPLLAADARAFEGLLLGRGHLWPFSAALGLYSSKGLLLTSAGGSVVRSAVVGKFGGDSLSVAAGAAVRTQALFPAGPAGTAEFATLSFWFSDNAGASWTHYMFASRTSQFYANGVATAGPTGLGVTYTGSLGWIFSNVSAGTFHFDDLWVAPYEMPVTWAAEIFNFNAAVGLAPRLVVDGACIAADLLLSVPHFGAEVRVTLAQGVRGGAFRSNLHSIEFTLAEV